MVKRIWNVFHQTFMRFARNDGITLAAATAYYAAFSFFPLLLVLIATIGFALRFSESAQSAQQELLQLLAERTVPEFESEVASVLSEVETRAPYNGPVGFVILVFGAIGIFSQIEFAFDCLWREPGRPDHGVRAAIVNALWNRLKAFLTLVALGVVLFVAFMGNLAMSAVRTWTEALPAGTSLWDLAQVGFTVALNTVVLTLLYRLIPRVGVRWLHAASGGLFAAVSWQLGSQLLSRFVLGGNYSAYGVVGSFIVVMLWVYCASVLLYLGAQLVQVLGNPYEAAVNSTTSQPQALVHKSAPSTSTEPKQDGQTAKQRPEAQAKER